jgi:hypothetical protein
MSTGSHAGEEARVTQGLSPFRGDCFESGRYDITISLDEEKANARRWAYAAAGH